MLKISESKKKENTNNRLKKYRNSVMLSKFLKRDSETLKKKTILSKELKKKFQILTKLMKTRNKRLLIF